ncbi:MAG: thioredoxin fold domain-containing protein [Puia sp.]|nr:thioredoxin fold domain-containing protein [Puia sp.]
MKKIILFLALASTVGCRDHKNEIKTGFEGKPLPSFNVLLMDSTTKLNTENIPSGEPVVVFYFNPYCPFCRAQTEEMLGNIKSLKNIRFYLVSNFPFEMIKKYYSDFQLNKYSNITVVQDYDAYFGNYYKAPGVPYIAIYNKEKILKKAFIGQLGSSDIKSLSVE